MTSLQPATRTAAIGGAVVFHVPAGVELAGEVVEDRTESIVVEFAPDVWEFIDEMWVFGLAPEHRRPGKVAGDGPVRVELRPAADGPFDDTTDLAATLVARTAADRRDRFLDTTAWHAIAVTEVVRDEGAVQLRSGFRTRWNESRVDHPLLDQVNAFFSVRDAPIDRTDGPEPMLSGMGDGVNGSWLLTIRADESTREILFESVAIGAPAADEVTIRDRWIAAAGALDEDGFADALADHLARMDDHLQTA